MYSVERLKPSETKLYSAFYNKHSNFPKKLSPEYLERCQLVRVIKRDGSIVGGYAINCRLPLRFQESVDDPAKYSDIFEDCIELASMSLICRSAWIRGLFYIMLTFDCLRMLVQNQRRWILGCTILPRFRDFNRPAMPHDLFEGRVGDSYYYVFYGSGGELLQALLTGLVQMIRTLRVVRITRGILRRRLAS